MLSYIQNISQKCRFVFVFKYSGFILVTDTQTFLCYAIQCPVTTMMNDDVVISQAVKYFLTNTSCLGTLPQINELY